MTEYLIILLIAAGAISAFVIFQVSIVYRQAVKEKPLHAKPAENGDLFSVEIVDEEIKGSETDKQRLHNFGGPGQLIVHPGQVVVLHHKGKITRAVGAGSVRLWGEEKIKAILPLGIKANIHKLENVRTQDKVPLNLTVIDLTQIEPAKETRARLEQEVATASKLLQSGENTEIAKLWLKNAEQELLHLERDKIIGDEYQQCYESIAKLVATKVPRVWDGLRNPIVRLTKDVIMSQSLEELFSTDGHELHARVFERNIARIEGFVLNQLDAPSRSVEGVMVRNIDISEIGFPEEIERAIKEREAGIIQATANAEIIEIQSLAETESKMAMLERITSLLVNYPTLDPRVIEQILRLTISTSEPSGVIGAVEKPVIESALG